MSEERAILPVTLPGVLGDIARVAGVEAALAIAEAVGGTNVYIPEKAVLDHWLSRLVGLENARVIVEELTCGIGSTRLDLPNGPRGFAVKKRSEVDGMIRAGKSERDIALATGYTIRGVRMRRAKLALPADSRQGRLFD